MPSTDMRPDDMAHKQGVRIVINTDAHHTRTSRKSITAFFRHAVPGSRPSIC